MLGGARATRGKEARELTKDDQEGENVNPVLLDETLLWLRRDDLALG